MRKLRVTQWGRTYLAIVAYRHLVTGVLALAAPSLFGNQPFEPMRALLPIQAWGGLFLLIGLTAVASVSRQSPVAARGVLIASGFITAWWALLLAVANYQSIVSPTQPLIWSALAAKDLLIGTRAVSQRRV